MGRHPPPASSARDGLPDRGQAWRGRWAGDSFFPLCRRLRRRDCRKAAIIVIRGIGGGPPRSPRRVEAEFFLQLLVSLFADPARLDGCSERLRGWRKVER